jgi:hypothetical protein
VSGEETFLGNVLRAEPDGGFVSAVLVGVRCNGSDSGGQLVDRSSRGLDVAPARKRSLGSHAKSCFRAFSERQVEFFQEGGPARIGMERIESREADDGGEFVVVLRVRLI